jgi:hypothetical protein
MSINTHTSRENVSFYSQVFGIEDEPHNIYSEWVIVSLRQAMKKNTDMLRCDEIQWTNDDISFALV